MVLSMEARPEVLIVGAGPVGLSAAILLARRGVRSLVAERHSSTTNHPKARANLTRTMEIVRPWGIETRLRAEALPQGAYRFIWIETLAGAEAGRVEPRGCDVPGPNSPVHVCMLGQDAVEAELYRYARTLPEIAFCFGTEATCVEQDAERVTAQLRDLTTGVLRKVDVPYCIAADGASSRVRERLGIPMRGPGGIADRVSIHFRAELAPWVRDRPAIGFLSARGNGTLLWAHGTDRWMILHPFDPKRGERREDFATDRCLAIVRRVVGIADLPVEIINLDFWTITAQVAERYREGRVFLAGDAAHRFPPTGGFGANTGIQDAHNLAWKIAGVLRGWAAPGLLDTYDAERRPVAQANTDFSVSNAPRWGAVERAIQSGDPAAVRTALAEQVKHLDSQGLDLGFCYSSGAVVPDGTSAPPVGSQTYVPSARPGARAPHVWLRPVGGARGEIGDRISTLDLFERDFCLLTGPDGRAWHAAGRQAAAGLGLPFAAHTIGVGGDFEAEADWADLYGVKASGAVLVRPDGHVAWRSPTMSAEPLATMRVLLCGLAGR